MGKRGMTLVKPALAGDLMMYIIVGVIVGGRLGYAAFYDQTLLITVGSSFPYWELLAINHGGMASHGGMVGVVVALILFGRRHDVPFLHLLDMSAIMAPPGLFLGRLANFINGELWGRPLPDQSTRPSWGIQYPQEVYPGQGSAIDLAPVADFVGGQGDLLIQNTLAHTNGGTPEVIEFLRSSLTVYYPSQLIQAIAEGPLLLLVIIIVWWRPRRPGLIAATFLMAYGMLRILTETVRQPDDGVALLVGLSRGQVLSIGMMIIGGMVAIWVSRRPVDPLGGLGKRLRDGGE
jgi:phosphatidylglycerol:prolipoprotein diacylglycerol transferase